MELIYMNHDREDLGILVNPEYDLAFGEDENNFECKVSLKNHCCEKGYYIYAEGTEYGGIVDAIEIDSENDLAIYTGRSWHGILASKVIEPLKSTDEDIIETKETTVSKSRLPDGFIEVEHIESDGNAYINTKIIGGSGVKAKCNYIALSVDLSNAFFLGSVAKNWSPRCYLVSYQSGVHSYGYIDHVLSTVPAELNKLYSVVSDFSVGTQSLTVNGTVIASSKITTTFTTDCPLYMFATNAAGNPDSIGKYRAVGDQEIYYNGTKVRHYVTCKKTNGTAGLFDLVDNEFFGNVAASGAFTAGKEVITNTTVTEKIPIVTLKRKDNEGTELLNRYLTISGDANACVKYILDRINLMPLFVVSEKLSDIKISEYQFDRFADAYSGLCDMLASAGMRLSITCENNVIMLSAVPIFNGSDGQELESDLIEYQMKKTYNNINHLVCIGQGKYEDRQIVHLYLDADGNVSETQTFFGVEERIQFDGESDEPDEEETRTAEQLAEERASLIENGTEKLLDLQAEDEIDVTFDSADDIYYIGDIVGAYDSTTDISVSAAVVKKIVSISRGRANIQYKVGAK